MYFCQIEALTAGHFNSQVECNNLYRQVEEVHMMNVLKIKLRGITTHIIFKEKEPRKRETKERKRERKTRHSSKDTVATAQQMVATFF